MLEAVRDLHGIRTRFGEFQDCLLCWNLMSRLGFSVPNDFHICSFEQVTESSHLLPGNIQTIHFDALDRTWVQFSV